MGRPRTKPDPELEKRAAARGYTLVQEDKAWYAEIGGTRWGPMTLEELDEFLPKE